MNNDERIRATKSFQYSELLASETVSDLRNLAKAAGIRLPPQMKRQQLISYLSSSVPDVLPEMKRRLSEMELLLCEIVACAGGHLPVAEVKLRGVVEIRRSKNGSVKEGTVSQYGVPLDNVNKKKLSAERLGGFTDDSPAPDVVHSNKVSDAERLLEFQVDRISYYGRGDSTAVTLFLFHRALYADADDRFYGKVASLVMPEEARKYFERKPVSTSELQERVPRGFEALRCADFPELIFAMLDSISRAASRRKMIKASPSLGRMPKNIVLPLLQKYVAPTEVFQKVPVTRFFEWHEVNEIISDYAHFTKLVQNDRGNGLKVSTDPAVLDLLASETKLCLSFIEWWASTENHTRVLRPRLFAVDGGSTEEATARAIIMAIIRDEMKPGRWYSVESIVDRMRTDEIGYHLDYFGIGRRGPWGTMIDACEEVCKTMIAWPLLLFGIIETDGPEMGYLRLGRWAAKRTTTVKKQGGPEASAADKLKGIVVTPNFEIVLQPEAKTLSFQLREFCESTNSEGPAIILRISKSSVLKAFRVGNYTAERIITLFANLGVQLPENVAHELNEWERRYGEVELRLAEIVECKDEALAAALMTDSKVKRHIVRRVGSTTLEVKPGSKSEILSRCDSLGLLAKG